MTFLLDQDTPHDIAFSLEALHHRVVRLRDVLPTESGDAMVLEIGRAHV